MASVFAKQGAYGKALRSYQRTIDGYEETLGKDHAKTISAAQQVDIYSRSIKH